MISSKVWDVKCTLAEMHGGVDPNRLEFVFKVGPSYKRHRNSDEIQSKILVKGIKGFHKGDLEWPHPYMVIGAGHMGLRQALHYHRKKVPYILFERLSQVGGNAWVAIANKTSKLQTEGPQYQLQYDVNDSLLQVQNYGYWPTRDEILAHFRHVCNEYSVTPEIRLNTDVVEMVVHDHPNPLQKVYEFHWKSLIDEESTGYVHVSNLVFHPGCLVVPHRKTWPGEDVFGGQIGYGFSHEFDHTKLAGQQALLIGMGAFAHENVRTFVEHGGSKVYNIARHFNLMMPRMICWWINQSTCPPTAAMVLHAMQPMYELIGLDPWSFFSVTANPDRTVASIKQYTRWGISDIYFLAIYFNKAEIITGEVKRFKPRCAILNTGRVIEDLDHIIKVIGFDGDFGVDRLMQATENIGPWPNGDWRRFTLSDQSAIDASRFTNIAISPAVSSFSFMTHHFHTHPEYAYAVLESGMLPKNYSEPEIGSPAYHFEPRKGTAALMTIGGFCPEIMAFEELNSRLKKASHHHLASPEAYGAACIRDWFRYCKLFKDQGSDARWPAYPYPPQEARRFVHLEDDLQKLEAQKYLQRHGISPQAQQEQQQERDQVAFQMPPLEQGERMCFEPARRVLQARARARSPARDATERQAWLQEGHEAKQWIIDRCRPSSPVPAIKRSSGGG